MKRITFTLPILLAAALLAACAPKATGPQPPEIVYNQDMCDECGMIISDARFAAATVLVEGAPRKFDDIGEMLVYHMDHPEAQVKAWFVHDYKSQAWIRGETAYFVKSDLLITPMAGSIAAFEDRAAAEAFAADKGGHVFTLDELRVAVHLAVHG